MKTTKIIAPMPKRTTRRAPSKESKLQGLHADGPTTIMLDEEPKKLSKKAQAEILKLTEDNDSNKAFESGARVTVAAVGSSGTEISGGYFAEEYLRLLRGKKGMKIYDEMRRSEPQISMILNGVMNPIKAANWDFEAAPSDVVPDSEKHAALLRACVFEQIDFEAFLHEVFTFLSMGFSMFEPINNVVIGHPEFGDFNGLKALAFRSQKTIDQWKVDKTTGQLLSVTQIVTGDIGSNVEIPAENLLIFSHQKEGDNYEGISLLRSMYGPYFRKNMYLKITAIGVEKLALGTPMAKVPAGKEGTAEFDMLKQILESYTGHESAYITFPEGWEITLQQSNFDPSKLKDLIVFENTEMANAAVANFLVLGMNGAGGAYALGSDLSDYLLAAIQCYADFVCDNINRQLVPSLIKLNFGPQRKYPTLKCTGINDKAGKELSEIIKTFVDSGVVRADDKLEEFARAQYSLPEADTETTRPANGQAVPAPVVDPNADPIVDPENPEVPAVPAVDVQSTALNGAQVTSIVEVVSKVTAKEISAESAIAILQFAFKVPEAEAKAMVGNAASLPVPEATKLAEEVRLQLADTYDKVFKKAQDAGVIIMQNGLREMLDGMKAEIETQYKSATDAEKITIGLNVEAKGVTKYRAALKEYLAEVANGALAGARGEIPGGKKFKLAESIQLAAPKGGFYNALPPNIRKQIDVQSTLISQSQAADLEKVVSFQYTSSANSTVDIAQILTDIEESAGKVISGTTSGGTNIEVAASNAVATIANQARMDFFFDPEVLETIESFTFENDDPVSEICQELNGLTCAVGDPTIDRYITPLHHLCKSRWVPNIKGDKGNPEIMQGPPSLSEKAIKQITLCECSYGILL